MIEPDLEGLQRGAGAGWSDSVTFHFADGERGVFGSARIGIIPGRDQCTALALLFMDGGTVAAELRGGLPWDGAGWAEARAGGVHAAIEQPLQRWSVGFESEEASFELEFTALGPAADFTAGGAAGDAVSSLSGMSHYEHFCDVRGTAAHGGRTTAVRCHGSRSHGWGSAGWDGLDGSRSLAAVFDDGGALSVNAVRPRGAEGHDADAVTGFLAAPGQEPELLEEVRLSVLQDAEQRPRSARLELTQPGGEFPRRCAGELVCGTSVELGELHLDATFFRWRMEGREGYGRFDSVSRAGDRAAATP